MYFAATFPYVILLTLLVTGLLQKGAMTGIMYFITPSFEKLLDINVRFWLNNRWNTIYTPWHHRMRIALYLSGLASSSRSNVLLAQRLHGRFDHVLKLQRLQEQRIQVYTWKERIGENSFTVYMPNIQTVQTKYELNINIVLSKRFHS